MVIKKNSISVIIFTVVVTIFIMWIFLFLSDDVQEKEDAQISGEFRDNRAIVDDNKAQSLSGEDVDEMRR